MQKYYKAFSVTGAINTETPDGGIESTGKEKKKVTAIIVNVSGYAGNTIRVWIDTELIAELYDYNLNTEANDGDTNTPYSTAKMDRIPIDHELDIGETLLVAINCGGTAKNIQGAYEYEILE